MPTSNWVDNFWTDPHYYWHPLKGTCKKPTVLERIEKMWERSNYYKTLPKPPVLTPSGPKPKPYYRTHERW